MDRWRDGETDRRIDGETDREKGKGKSTSTAIMEITRKLFSNYNQNLHTSCLFVDYKKAFETLDHKIMLQKLKQLGFDASSLRWVESYLGNRRHVVKCANMTSSEINVHYGVPQGSILGPLYFIIYVNDFLTKISTCNNLSIIMYADDTVILTHGTSATTATDTMQEVLTRVTTWCNTNKLTINVKKTKHMLVSRVVNHELELGVPILHVNGEPLSNVESYHYLGVCLNRKLSFDETVRDTYIKANKKLYTLRRIRPYISTSVAMLVFKQFILPILDYGDFLFDSATKDSLDNLDKIQKRAIRIIDNGAHAAYTQEAKELHYGLRPLCQRRHEHHLLIMYRLSHVVEYLDVDRPEIVLGNRNKIKFNSEVTKLTRVMNSPYYRGIKLWDRLAEEVQKATTKVKFKILIGNK